MADKKTTDERPKKEQPKENEPEVSYSRKEAHKSYRFDDWAII